MKEGFWRSWFWHLVLAACAAHGDWSDCLPSCHCKWISGKRSASCIGVGLRKPPRMSPDLQVLDLHDNKFITLSKEAFSSVGLLNLQKINLSSSQLKEINTDSFKDLRILVELDLSHNNITKLPQNIFMDNERLKLVILSGNPLKALIESQFPLLPHLKILDFLNCQLRFIHPLAFHNLHALESLDLRNNKLIYISVKSMDLPSLKALFLSGNPWKCDCIMKNFKIWFLRSNLGNEELQCSQPDSLFNKLWKDIDDLSMGCAPEVKPSSRVIRSEVGTELSFGCKVRGYPRPVVTWLYNGLDIINFTYHRDVLFEESGDLFFEDRGDFFFQDSSYEDYVKKTRWFNVTLFNVSNNVAGEWSCAAKNSVGETFASINIVLPRARAATARTAPAIPTVVGAIGGALGALCLLGLVIIVICWQTKRRRVPPSRSFTDQEKKLLDVSIAVGDRSSTDLSSPFEFEMLQKLSSPVQEERKINFDPVHLTIESCSLDPFPPPPPEFALPSTTFGNIYISVQLAGIHHSYEKYPDLLGGGATLPARACCKLLAYDNMGPRITATGSSTWSLPGSGAEESTSLTPAPPLEFVSL